MNARLEKTAKVGHLVFAIITTIVSFLVTAAVIYGATMQRLDDVETKANSVQSMREDIVGIKTDLGWIKEKLK